MPRASSLIGMAFTAIAAASVALIGPACGGPAAEGGGAGGASTGASRETFASQAVSVNEAGAPEPSPSGFAGEMTPVRRTSMAADLSLLGLDVSALPPLSKMDPRTLRAVMKTFTSSLGLRCNGCHDMQDFAARTPMKSIADAMWTHFVQGLTLADGTPVFCDSCHQERAKMLDRSDGKRLSKWMQANYVDAMKRRDGQEQSCGACHGDPFASNIFRDVWHVQ